MDKACREPVSKQLDVPKIQQVETKNYAMVFRVKPCDLLPGVCEISILLFLFFTFYIRKLLVIP